MSMADDTASSSNTFQVEHKRHVWHCSRGHAWETVVPVKPMFVGGNEGSHMTGLVMVRMGDHTLDGDYCLRCLLALLGKVKQVE